jgi:hypothetical protein
MEEIKMTTKFQVGDIVKGNNPSRYGVTDDKMTRGEVVRISEGGRLSIKIIKHDANRMLGETFPNLSPEYFDLVERKSGKLKVGDIVKGIKGSPYYVTSHKMRKGVVTHVHHDGDVSIKVLEHDNSTDVGDTYPVKPEYFVLVEQADANEVKIKELEAKVATLEKKVNELEAKDFMKEIGLDLPVPVSAPMPVSLPVETTFKAELGENVSFEGTKEDFKDFLDLMESFMKRTESNTTYRF